MFDVPLERCPVCNSYVVTDQTQKECAREHGCGQIDCALKGCFTGLDFSQPVDKAAVLAPPKPDRRK